MREGLSYSEAGKKGYEKSKDGLKEYYQKLKDKYYAAPSVCKACKKVLPYEKRFNDFCNHSCRAVYINKRRTRKDARKIIACEFCGESTKNSKYCNNKCASAHKWDKIKKEILQSGVVNYGPRTAKRYLFETVGVKCSICNLTEWHGEDVPLVLDHIDGNSDNNRVDNIRLVCGNCDMQLPTYKNKNKGNGRVFRRKCYKDGKSY